jgi:predicted ATP-grasp superfamily ATP-dependent carboligase
MTRGPRVLVTDAEGSGALAACRGLQAAGYNVAAAASRRLAVGQWSRSCRERVWLPDPRRDPSGYIERLTFELRRGAYDVLLPGSEASLIPISERRDVVEPHVLLGLPAHETVLRSLDKVLLINEAAATGLAPPPSLVCSTLEGTLAAARRLGYPVVAKPQRTFAEHDGRLRERPVELVHDEPALARAAALLGTPLVIQQYVARPGIVFCAGVRIGERVLGFTFARFARTWPPDAGQAAMALTVDPPPRIEASVYEVLSRIGWTGIFQLQLLDLGGGRFGLIDLNPRLYASLALSLRAGANLPTLWCDHLLGRDSTSSDGARAGVRYRREDSELRYVVRQALSGEMRAALSALRPHRRVAHAYFELRDPVPLVVQALMIAVDAYRGRSWLAPSRVTSGPSGEESRVTAASDL